MGDEATKLILSELPYRLPGLAIDLIGIAFCVYFWRRHRAVSVCCLVAVLLRATESVGDLLLTSWLRERWTESITAGSGLGLDHEKIERQIRSVGVVVTIMQTISYALLVFSVFLRRSSQTAY